MSEKAFRWTVGIFVAAWIIGVPMVATFANPHLTWAMQTCSTLEEVTQFLNTLPEERALEAKVLTINSQRSFGGVFSSPYRIFYRR